MLFSEKMRLKEEFATIVKTIIEMLYKIKLPRYYESDRAI